MRPNYIKLHEFMLAGKDFEDSDVSEETLKLKHNSLVARLNTPRGKQSKLNYFNENYPATYLGQATRILKVSKHHYTRFFEDLGEGKKHYEPVIEMTGYLVELPKYIVKSLPEFVRREYYTLVTERVLSENRAEALKGFDIADQELDETDTYSEETGEFTNLKTIQKIRDELGDTYKNSDFYKKMSKEKLEKNKAKQFENWDNMAKMVKNPDAKITGGDVPKFIANALKPAEEKWERVLNRGSLDFQSILLDNQYRFDKYSALRKAIDKSPDDPLAQKALVQLVAMEKEVNDFIESKRLSSY